MRKITKEAVNAFINGLNYKKNNTIVRSINSSSKMELHGNIIAMKNDITLQISNCGYFTNTTKERLNAVLSSFGLGAIKQKKGKWYLNSEEFLGSKVFDLQKAL